MTDTKPQIRKVPGITGSQDWVRLHPTTRPFYIAPAPQGARTVRNLGAGKVLYAAERKFTDAQAAGTIAPHAEHTFDGDPVWVRSDRKGATIIVSEAVAAAAP